MNSTLDCETYDGRLKIKIILRYNELLAKAVTEIVRPNDGSAGREDLYNRRLLASNIYYNMHVLLGGYTGNPALQCSFEQRVKKEAIAMQQLNAIDDYMAYKVEQWAQKNYKEYRKRKKNKSNGNTPKWRYSFDSQAWDKKDFAKIKAIYHLDTTRVHKYTPDPKVFNNDSKATRRMWFNHSSFTPWLAICKNARAVDALEGIMERTGLAREGNVGTYGEVYDPNTGEVTNVPQSPRRKVLRVSDVNVDKAAVELCAFILADMHDTIVCTNPHFTYDFPKVQNMVFNALADTIDSSRSLCALMRDMALDRKSFVVGGASNSYADLDGIIARIADIVDFYHDGACTLDSASLLIDTMGAAKYNTSIADKMSTLYLTPKMQGFSKDPMDIVSAVASRMCGL